MIVAIVANQSAGRGRGPAAVLSVADRLGAEGVEVRRVPLGPADRMGDALSGVDAVVVAGGDGTVNSVVRASAGQVPVYQMPMGTENLFAREFGMTPDPEAVVRAVRGLRAGLLRRTDMGLVNGRAFVLMVSVGPDASVIHRVASTRQGRITHWSYAGPILRELADPSFPRLEVTADGRRVVDGARGLLVVANSRQYAMRLDPARRAVTTDGLLDVVFLACRSRAGVLRWVARAFLGRHLTAPGAVSLRASSVEVQTPDGPAPVQVDGERLDGAERTPLRIEVAPGALRVMAGLPRDELSPAPAMNGVAGAHQR